MSSEFGPSLTIFIVALGTKGVFVAVGSGVSVGGVYGVEVGGNGVAVGFANGIAPGAHAAGPYAANARTRIAVIFRAIGLTMDPS